MKKNVFIVNGIIHGYCHSTRGITTALKKLRRFVENDKLAYYAICGCLEARKSPCKALIAFSGEKEYDGKMLNEASINGFASTAK